MLLMDVRILMMMSWMLVNEMLILINQMMMVLLMIGWMLELDLQFTC